MYHIKNDRRALASTELICRGLLEALRKKPYRDITVSDIQRLSTVSRSTFYRNFDCMDDVLALLCDRGFQEAFGSDMPIPLAIFRYWYGHWELLEAVVQVGKADIFLESFRRGTEESGIASFMASDSAEFDYFLSTIAYTMIGTLVTWIRRGRRESEEQLMAALKNAFSAMDKLNVLMLN